MSAVGGGPRPKAPVSTTAVGSGPTRYGTLEPLEDQVETEPEFVAEVVVRLQHLLGGELDRVRQHARRQICPRRPAGAPRWRTPPIWRRSLSRPPAARSVRWSTAPSRSRRRPRRWPTSTPATPAARWSWSCERLARHAAQSQFLTGWWRRGRPHRVRRPPGRLPEDGRRLDVGGGSNVFYTIVFAGLAVLLVVAVIVQKSRRK